MTLQQFLDSYHLDHDYLDEPNYDNRYDNASCFMCDAQEHPDIKDTVEQIHSFTCSAFSVTLR